jgi:hypothetical protein
VFCLEGGGGDDIALVKSLPDYCITVLSVKIIRHRDVLCSFKYLGQGCEHNGMYAYSYTQNYFV